MAKLCNDGETWLLGLVDLQTDLSVGLYLDSSEPAEDATLGGLSEPDGEDGYAREDITEETADVTDDLLTWPEVTFTATAAWGNVYGWFLTDGTNLITVENFSNGPYNVQNDGDQIKVTPKLRAA
jgi:hypothetical protein